MAKRTRPYSVFSPLPNPALPGADWSDAYEIHTCAPINSAEEAATQALGPMPGWVKVLLAVRNRLVALVGLKAASARGRPSGVHMIGPFPVVSCTNDHVVLGFDDRHLDFRVVIALTEHADGRRSVRATTVVKRHNLAGRLYLALIMPFHKLIVRSTLKRIGRSSSSMPAAVS